MSASTARATRRPAQRAMRPSARQDKTWSGDAPAGRVRRPHRRAIAPAVTQPALHVVRSVVPRRSTVPFILLVSMILVGALAASMLLNAHMAGIAFKMKAAQVELNVINDHIDTVRSQVEQASSSEALAERASQLGMVPAGSPGVVDLSSAAVTGGAPAESPDAGE